MIFCFCTQGQLGVTKFASNSIVYIFLQPVTSTLASEYLLRIPMNIEYQAEYRLNTKPDEYRDYPRARIPEHKNRIPL